MKKKKILIVCSAGKNRSRYVANYLRRKGYSTRFGGVKESEIINPVNPKYIEWADLIIFAQEKQKKWFVEKFGDFKKNYLILDVRDSGHDVPEDKKYLLKLPKKEFNRVWVHPNLRKKLKEFKLVK